ncbi:LytR/AlgR family response regulator transcription factor [Arundinibacter roseus]|nr:response regulator transcription factor [Arundinibacter roseus]
MQDITLLVLEDNEIDQIQIEMMLNAEISTTYKYRVLAWCTSLEELILALETHQPDLILSDIFIEGKPEGLKLLKSLKNSTIPIVMMTSSSELSVYQEVMHYKRLHYLAKPLNKFTLHSALEKTLEEYLQAKHYKVLDRQFIYLSHKTGYTERVNFRDIVYIEAEGNYAQFFTRERKYVLKKSLARLLEEDLDGSFLRLHNKFVINNLHVLKITDNSVILTGEIELPIGKSFRKEVHAYFK